MGDMDLWERFKRYYCSAESIGLRLDISRMRFGDTFFEQMAEPIRRAFEAMADLEAGGIANPDESRMVGHYWLRSPQLAPTDDIRTAITDTVADIHAFASAVHRGVIKPPSADRFTQYLSIGIGGSALGPQFVADALGGPDDRMTPFFCDNTDPDGIDRTLASIGSRLNETLALVISKSGGTKETRNAMLEVRRAYESAGLEFPRHAVAITGSDGALHDLADSENWLRCFPMWDWVGGRTSQMSAVGLVPAALQGFDIDALLAGAAACDAVTRMHEIATNPAALLDYLHFHRARKTAYELAAMRYASDVGAAGHIAAAQAFAGGGTEFDIHMAYLSGAQQAEVDLPYGNIVGLNEHAAVLHYQHQNRRHDHAPRSLLIDAGGSYRGYASDITRTYAGSGENDFAELLKRMQSHQQALIDSIRPGVRFADLHVQMHRQLAAVLADAELVTCAADAAFEQGITEAFCPHGLGHLLGLQVHDVGGHLADDHGNPAPPPEQYPSLRFTREIDVDYVFTIEPGLYFIPSLLQALKNKRAAVNWARVDALAGCGGIRIEDNVRVLDDGVENLTRDAFARQRRA